MVDIDTVLVLEGRVRTLPGRDAASTAAQSNIRVSHPACSEAVEEISLAGNLTVVHERIAQFADVDLELVVSGKTEQVDGSDLRCLDSSRSVRNRKRHWHMTGSRLNWVQQPTADSR